MAADSGSAEPIDANDHRQALACSPRGSKRSANLDLEADDAALAGEERGAEFPAQQVRADVVGLEREGAVAVGLGGARDVLEAGRQIVDHGDVLDRLLASIRVLDEERQQLS